MLPKRPEKRLRPQDLSPRLGAPSEAAARELHARLEDAHARDLGDEALGQGRTREGGRRHAVWPWMGWPRRAHGAAGRREEGQPGCGWVAGKWVGGDLPQQGLRQQDD